MRHTSFIAQVDAGVQWLHVHPINLCGPDEWDIVRIAAAWRDGMLPEGGGVGDQAAWTFDAVRAVLDTWRRMQAAADERNRPRR